MTHQIPRQPLERRRLAPRDSYDYESNNKRTFYIVPPGMNVIFRDEFGNELKRQVNQFTLIIRSLITESHSVSATLVMMAAEKISTRTTKHRSS